MTETPGTVIVGAGLAGLTVAEGLRAEGYTGPITLIGAEDHVPYSRPPLSKQVLSGKWTVDQTALSDTAKLAALRVRFLRGQRATSVDLGSKALYVGAHAVPFEHLVAATGVVARRMAKLRDLRGIHTLRTIDDAVELLEELAVPRRVVVLGAGILGCEIAAATRTAGHEVALVGRASEPRFGNTGGHISRRIAHVLRDHSVRMHMGVHVDLVQGNGAVQSLVLSDGSVLDADVVIAAIGSEPVVEWLIGTGIDLTDGVLCNSHGVAADRVYAVGDVARWPEPSGGEPRRVEHQATAIEQAHAVARLIATGGRTAPIESFFWSELFGNRILVHGFLREDLPLTLLAGDFCGQGFVAATILDGRTTGIVGWNLPREFRQERARLVESTAAQTKDRKGILVT